MLSISANFQACFLSRTAFIGLLSAVLVWPLTAKADADSTLSALTDNVAIRSVTDALGFVREKTKKVLGVNKEIPTTIAVLPATGDGNREEQADISNAIHNNLGVSQFSLIKPHITERKLAVLEDRLQKPWTEIAPEIIAAELKSDGLLYINVDNIDQLYAAAYAHYEITITATLHSSLKPQPVWQHTDSIIEREGGISLNPLGIIATAVTSAKLLSEATRIHIVDQLARKFAEIIPEPVNTQKERPPSIRLALSNAAEGPFRAGNEVKVFMEADPELEAEFIINERQPIRLEEQTPGNYLGRYVVKPGDDIEEGYIEVKAFRPSDKVKGFWNLPGRIAFDTLNPEPVTRLDTQVTEQGVRLSWSELQDQGSALHYQVERADPSASSYQLLASTAIAEFIDADTRDGESYFYRVTAVDMAGNKGDYATSRVIVVAPGPTQISADISSDRRLPAIGSPYRLDSLIRVNRDSTLTFEPGSIIEMEPGAGLHILGRLQAEGTEKAPITFKGEGAKLLFDNTGTTENRFSHVQLRTPYSQILLDNAKLQIDQSRLNGVTLISASQSLLELTNTTIGGASTALISRGGDLRLQHTEISNNQLGLLIETGLGQSHLFFDDSAFTHNQIHISSEQTLAIQGVRFPKDSFETLASHLEGPVSIAWDSLHPDDNLRDEWLKLEWGHLLSEMKRQNSVLAKSKLLKIIEAGDSEAAKILYDSLQTLAGEEASYPEHSADFVTQINQARKANKTSSLWVQNIQIPGNQTLLNNEVMLLPKARARFSRDYLYDHYADKKRSEAFLAASRLPLEQAATAAKLLYRRDRGLVSDAWILYALDSSILDHHLSIAGLIQRAAPNILLATVIEGDEQVSLKRELYRLLESQNIPFVDLSGLRKINQMAQAKKQQADLLLTARILGQTNASSLNQNLKVVEVDISLQVEAVNDGALLTNLHKESKTTAFNKLSGYEKAISSSLKNLEEPLLRELTSYRKPDSSQPSADPVQAGQQPPTQPILAVGDATANTN